jgi:hypothetical protein
MKNMLLLLLTLIIVPAWAGDVAPDTQTGVSIELKGSAKSLSALVADLEKDAVYKEAACSTAPAKKSGETVKISCAKADGALMTFLSKNAQTVHWSISALANKSLPATAKQGVVPMSCPTGCSIINCPPPSGPLECCHISNHTPC